MKMIKLTKSGTDGTPVYVNADNINRISTHKSYNRPAEFTYIDMVGDSDDSYFEVKETAEEVLAMLSASINKAEYCQNDVSTTSYLQGWNVCKTNIMDLVDKYFPDNGAPVAQSAVVDFIDALDHLNDADMWQR